VACGNLFHNLCNKNPVLQNKKKKSGGKTFAYERTDLAGELRVAKHVIYILEWPHSWPLANSLQFAGFSWIFGIIYAVIADAQGRGWGN